MLRRTSICLIAVFGLVVFSLPVMAEGIRYFDAQGNAIEKQQYEQLKKAREASVAPIMRDGFGEKASRIADPIKLRQKRLAQWERYRERQK